MQRKAFIFTALLSGLGTLLFGQKTQVNASFLNYTQAGAAFTMASFNSTQGTVSDNYAAIQDLLPPGKDLKTTEVISTMPSTESIFNLVTPPILTFTPATIPDGIYGSVYSDQTITVTGGTAPYTFSITASSLPPGMSISSDGIISGTPTAAGTYTFTVTVQDNTTAPGPIVESQDYTLVIDQVPLTITGNNVTMPYGGTLPTLGVSYSGFVNGDDVSSLTSQPSLLILPATPFSPVGSYPITVFGAIDPNYSISYVKGTLSITPVALTIKANDASMTYGGSVPTLTATYTGFVNGDNASSLTTHPTLSTTASPTSIVGTYPITASAAVDPNYTITYQTGTMTVGKASLTVTADNKNMPLGGPLPTLTISYTGFVNGDNATGLTTAPTATTTATATSPAGAYTITPGGGASSNYTFTYVNGVLTVAKGVLIITANPATSVYGAVLVPNGSLTVSYSGFMNGDGPGSMTVAPIVTNAAIASSPVGSYALTPSGAANPNYTIQYINGIYSITKATLTVTADNKNMPLGGPLPTLTISYTGFVNGDNVANLTTKPTASTTAIATSPAGTYPITPSGGSSSNYTFIYVNGTLSVAKALLTITANPAGSIYGASLVPNGSLTVSYSGFVNGDGPGSMTTPPIVTNAAVAGAPAGTYTLTASGAVNPNYAIVYVNGIYTITKATLNVTADNKSMPLGGPLPALTISYTGFVNGDNASSLTIKPAATTTATATSPAGNYTITSSGGSSSNYTFSYINGTLAVTKGLLTITANPAGSIYGAPLVPNGSLTVSYSGFVNGDGPSSLTSLPNVTNTAITGAPVGSYSLTPSGSASPNYTIQYINGIYTISKAILTVTPDNQSMPLGGPLPTFTISYSGFVNGDNITSLIAVPTATTTATVASPAGGYPITPSGGSSSNYTFNYVNGTLAVAKAFLTITANPAGSIYGASLIPDGSLTVSYSGFVSGDGPGSMTVPPIVSNTAFTGAPAGNYTLTPSGAVNPNYVILYVNGNYTISPATLNVTADNKSMPLGGPLPALTISYTGFVNGDNATSLTTQPTITTTATASSSVNTYPITASGAIDPSYIITYTSGTLTVNPAALIVNANAQTKEYGATDPVFTYTVSGFLNGDSTGIFTGSLNRMPGENVGTYSITKGNLSAGSNYQIIFNGNNLTITIASQHITWAQSLIVGCNDTTQVHLTAKASSGLPVTYSVSDTSVAKVSGNVLTFLHPGITVVTATQAGDGNNTPATAIYDTVYFKSASLIRQHWSDAIFFDNSSGDYIQWQWYKNVEPVAGATSPYYSESPSLNGQYYVVATNKDGQLVQSCVLNITGGAAISGGIKASPNPVNSGALVTVTCNYPGAALQGAQMQIVDITGRVRQQVMNVQQSMQITMPSESGIYIINLLLTDGQKASTNVLVK